MDDTREIDYDMDELCEYEGCSEKAWALVYSAVKQLVLKCCEKHADQVIEENHPEYNHFCENCDCWLPIN